MSLPKDILDNAPNGATHYMTHSNLTNCYAFFDAETETFQSLDRDRIYGSNWCNFQLYPQTPREKYQHDKPDLNDGKKYERELIGLCGTKVKTDVYRVLDAFKTDDAILDHLIKKALCAGSRGHKDKLTDYRNIAESAQKALELLEQKK